MQYSLNMHSSKHVYNSCSPKAACMASMTRDGLRIRDESNCLVHTCLVHTCLVYFHVDVYTCMGLGQNDMLVIYLGTV